MSHRRVGNDSPVRVWLSCERQPERAASRWSQATEQRIGENGRRKTLMFNGYEAQVASLYEGLDLSVNF